MTDHNGWSQASKSFGGGLFAIPSYYSHQASILALEKLKSNIHNDSVSDGSIYRCCDVAAGVGTFTSMFLELLDQSPLQHKESWQFEVTDFAQGLITTAIDKFKNSPILSKYQVNFSVMSAEELKYDDSLFDLVSCKFGIMFVPNKHKALSEMYRIMKPTGKLVISTWHQTDLADIVIDFGRYLGHVTVDVIPDEINFVAVFQMPVQLEAALKDVGFKDINIHQIEHEFILDNSIELFNAIASNPVMKLYIGEQTGDIYHKWNEYLNIHESKYLRNDGKSIRFNMTANIALASK